MPEVRNYTITQEREVKVSAENIIDALKIADAVFENQSIPGNLIGRTLSDIRVRELLVREEY